MQEQNPFPVILTSRADSVIARLASCAVTTLVAQARRTNATTGVCTVLNFNRHSFNRPQSAR
jgi:hypothetical protein